MNKISGYLTPVHRNTEENTVENTFSDGSYFVLFIMMYYYFRMSVSKHFRDVCICVCNLPSMNNFLSCLYFVVSK